MPKITSPAPQSFAFNHQSNLRSCCGIILALAWLAGSAAQAQTTNYALGTTALLVGPEPGSNSVVLGVTPATGAWTASANTNWLHLDPAKQSGTGSTNVIFSYDANPGATRSGTLTIGDQTLTVTQAGSTYVAVEPVTVLVYFPGVEPESVSGPLGLAVDSAGNAYTLFNDINGSSWIEEWVVANNTVTNLRYSNLDDPQGVAADGAGNLYFANVGNGTINEWTAANSNWTILVSSGLSAPYGVAVNGAGNVYIADTDHNAIKEWTVANSNVTTLVSSGLSAPYGVAADGAGNVYIADTLNNAIKEWTAANSSVTTLVSSGLSYPDGVAVDGAGNVYVANSPPIEWTAVNNNVITFVPSALSSVHGVAVDGAGNVYVLAFPSIAFSATALVELPHAFVDPNPRLVGPAAGNDALPAVLPATENLRAPFAPTSDQSWLTITGITNGVVSFSFTANTGRARTAHITLLGQTIPVTQGVIGTPPDLSGVRMLGNGVLQFAFTSTPGAFFTVLSTTNLSLPLSYWTVVGAATNTAPGRFQFTSQPTTNDAQRFYGVRSP